MKVSITLGCLIVVLAAAGFTYAYHLKNSVKETAHAIYEPVVTKSDHGKKVKKTPTLPKKDPQPLSILLMGVDQRPHDVGRTDTLIVLTLNPKTNQMQMISIPRDTRVSIPGKGIHKINAAYAYGGTALTLQTVQDYLHIPIDYYIRLDMEGVSKLVDAVGGIRVYNDLSWHDEGYYDKGFYYHKGWLELNGPQTLGFVRMRHLDPRGDFGRNKRQREVILAIVDKAADFSNLTKYDALLEAIKDSVRTDMKLADMKFIAQHYRDCRQHVKEYEVKGHGEIIDGLWYLVVPDEEVQKVHQMVMAGLGSEK
ncbi:MAG TPA: LCP family protein [Bacillales bacterium]|nr:LCP family protein [Bacillales bacterium]